MKTCILILGLTVAFLACGGREHTQTIGHRQRLARAPSRPPPIDALTQHVSVTSPSGAKIQGEVVETMNAGDYAYSRLGTPNGEVWTAVPVTTVKKGATVTVDVQMVAEKFQSNTMHRTFDKLRSERRRRQHREG